MIAVGCTGGFSLCFAKGLGVVRATSGPAHDSSATHWGAGLQSAPVEDFARAGKAASLGSTPARSTASTPPADAETRTVSAQTCARGNHRASARETGEETERAQRETESADEACTPCPPRSQAGPHTIATQSNTQARLENASAGKGPTRVMGADGTQLLRPREGSVAARGPPSGHREIFHAKLDRRWRNNH